MKSTEFAKLMERDGGRCVHCGTTEGLVPQHRINRGNGGRKSLEIPSNVILLCSIENGLIESNPKRADVARAMGWKLRDWAVEDLLILPFYDRIAQSWFWLDNDYHRTAVDG